MRQLTDEAHAMQNSALGAALLWRFCCGYSPRSSTTGVPMTLVFIVLPLTLHATTLKEISATNASSGLRKFETKFADRADLLLGINDRARTLRPLTLRSLRVGLASGLLTLVPSDAILWPLSFTQPPGVNPRVLSLLKAAEKLGAWCANLTLFEIAGILKVEF